MPDPQRLVNPHREDSDRVFILRFWVERESAPGSATIWRAKVSDVVSGEEKHVHGIEAALEYVREAMGATPV